MFLGTHHPALDDKGRLFLPAKFRDELAEGLVITKGQERCLYVFPAAEFAAMTERMRPAPVTSKAGPRLHAGASSPAPRRDRRTSRAGSRSRRRCATYAGLDRDVRRHRRRHPVEIWDAAAWETYLGRAGAARSPT